MTLFMTINSPENGKLNRKGNPKRAGIDIDNKGHIYKRFRYWSDVAFPKYTKNSSVLSSLEFSLSEDYGRIWHR
jgi:hypothetical protein